MSSDTKAAATIAAIIWLIIITAAVDMALGNPTAINAVIGCSIPAAATSCAAWAIHRQDRRPAGSKESTV